MTESIFADIEKAGVKVETFLANVVTGVKKLKTLYQELSGPVIATSVAVFTDAVKAVAAGESAAAAATSGNITLTVALSQNTITMVKQLVTDFKAGEKTIVSDFETLGIKL
jgi:hypothetical protein